jgi:H+/Cl- antiporter ClcA
LSSPVIVVMLILELFRPGGEKLTRTLVNTVVASSVSFGIYFAVAGSVFLDIYQVPQYSFKSWQLLVGVAPGVVTAVLVMGMVLLIAVCARAFTRLRVPRLLKPVIGDALFGVIGVTLPLTMFSGADQLTTVINDAPALGTGLVLTLVVAKIFTLAVSSASGFVGGPGFPALFIGGTAGVAVYMLAPGIPLTLSFTCMLAAVPGALVSAPSTMVLLAVFVTQWGPADRADPARRCCREPDDRWQPLPGHVGQACEAQIVPAPAQPASRLDPRVAQESAFPGGITSDTMKAWR